MPVYDSKCYKNYLFIALLSCSSCKAIDENLLNGGDAGVTGSDASVIGGDTTKNDAGLGVNELIPKTPGSIIVTEIMLKPTLGTFGEYFEVFNTTQSALNLEGCVIHNKNADDAHTISSNLMILPQKRLVLAYGDAETANFAPDYSYNQAFQIDKEDSLSIVCNEVLIDIVDFSQIGDFPISNGASISLSPQFRDGLANDLMENWCVSANFVYTPGNFGTPGGANQACGALTPGANGVVISEFMTKSVSDNGEYVEIYNPTSTLFDLLGCSISDEKPEKAHIISESVAVSPGGYITLAFGNAAGAGFTPDYSYKEAFKLGGEDSVVLTCGSGDNAVIVDEVVYSEALGFLGVDFKSFNLTSTNLSAITNDFGANWCVSVAQYTVSDYGTPGTANRDCSIAANGTLVINEIAAKGAPADWFELYNGTEETIDLSLYTVTDDDLLPAKGAFAPGTTIAAGQYLFFEVGDTVPLRSFGLGGEDMLLLLDNTQTVVDSINWLDGNSPIGGSFGRIPNGTGAFVTLSNPTKEAPNTPNSPQ